MKKMILSLMCAAFTCTAFAVNCVSVKQISTDYTTHQITIALTRSGCSGDATNHRNTVWVFVDYRAVTGATKGAWTRAAISAASAGTVVNSGSSKGAWINGANGTQTVTLTLSGMPEKYDWCAFATDYPPNVTLDKGVFTFAGNASFVTSTPQTIAGNTIAKAGVTANATTTFTDATGCPGIGSLYCPYTGNDLYMDPTHLCQQRSSGAQNWEAYIKDSRDNTIYRMVQMPTTAGNQWWMAQDLQLTTAGEWFWGQANNLYPPVVGRFYTVAQAVNGNVCPTGWRLPAEAELNRLRDNFGLPALKLTGTVYWGDSTSGTQSAANGTDTYGFSLHGYGGRFSGTWLGYCRRNATIVDQTGIWFWGCLVSNNAVYPCSSGNGGCFSGGNSSYITSGIVRCMKI